MGKKKKTKYFNVEFRYLHDAFTDCPVIAVDGIRPMTSV
jgi:hypothetical protein